MKLTAKTAYKYAVKKWQYIVDHNGDYEYLTENMPVLNKFIVNCSYCELYNGIRTCDNPCKGCPLNLYKKPIKKYKLGCDKVDHPYAKWCDHPTKRNAQAVLDLIIKNKPV